MPGYGADVSIDTGDEVVLGAVDPALRRHVSAYVGYRQLGLPPGIHRGLPSVSCTFIISLAEPVTLLEGPGTGPGPLSCDALVAGLHTAPALIRREHTEYGIALELTPLGTRTLLGLPAAALANTTVGLDDILGRRAHHLTEELRQADSWQERFAILDRRLLELASPREPDHPPGLAHAWRLLSSDPTRDVSATAAEVGWSRRHLGRLMSGHLGVSPAEVRRLARFGHSARLLRSNPRPAQVAAEAGYYDQAHMVRHWRALAGCTPSQWLADEVLLGQPEPVPSVQDPDRPLG